MKGIIQIAAVGCALAGAEARAQGPYKWSRDENGAKWLPARETPDLAFQPLIMLNPPPIQTPAPALSPRQRENLEKRASTDNTCAYVDGKSDASLYCNVDSACVYNSVRSNIGCCPDTSISCPIWTTCFHSSQGSSYTTNNGYSLWCGSSAYPSCLQHIFYDATFSGYTLWGCGKTAGSDTVYYKPTSSSSRRSSSTSSSSSRSSSSSSSSSTDGTSTPTPAPGPVQEPQQSSTNVGAIAGGVVGGVAVLGLIGTAIIFLLRKKNKDKASTVGSPPNAPPAGPAAAAAAGGWHDPSQGPPPGHQSMYGPPPQMAQQPGYPPAAGFAPVDPRASIAKPPYAAVTQSYYDPTTGQTISPPNSPPPQSHSPGAYGYGPHGAPSPTSTSAYGNVPPGQPSPSMTGPYSPSPPQGGPPQPGFGYQSGPVPEYGQSQAAQPQGERGFVAELPTQKPDRELRELA